MSEFSIHALARKAVADCQSADPREIATAFVNAIPASIRAFFYASGSSSDAAKAPSPFTARIALLTSVPPA